MTKQLLSLSAAALLFLGGAALAQENTDEAQTQPETSQTDPAAGLDLGQSGPRVGEQFVKQVSGDWEVSCIKAETGEDPCAIVQVLNGAQGDPIAEVTIGKLPEGGAAVAWANVVVPLETLLQAQLALSIDGAPRKLYNYHHCIRVGCVAQLGLSQADIDAMKSGNSATFSLVPAQFPDQVLSMEMSLSGFTAGFDAIGVNIN